MKIANRVLLLLAFVLAAGLERSSVAQTIQTVAGQWALKLGDRTIFVLSLAPSAGQKGPFTGTLARPAHFQTRDAVSFSHVMGPTEIESIVESQWRGDSVSFTVQDPKDPADKTEYLLTLKDNTDAELQPRGIPLPPLKLRRVTGVVSVSNDWHSGETYSPDDDAPSNPEMRRIFEEDQSVRKSWPNIDWAVVDKSDAARRAQTKRLLDAGALHSGEDFNWAANVFQHGSRPEDYLFAHTLAMIAVRKGYSDAMWIAAATLDRYLQSINQPQIYGTQFLSPTGKVETQEPYDRSLIPDSLRRQLGVPDLAAQEIQRQQYEAQRHGDSKSPNP